MDANITNMTNGTNATVASPVNATPPGQTVTIKSCLIAIAVIAFVGNGIVVYFITTRRHLRTKTNIMVVSLAISDLCVALAIIPSYLACMYVKCDPILAKLFYDGFLFISVCNLCCITFDRFLAVTRPLRYHMKVTRRRVIGFVIISWVVPGVVSIVPATWLYTDTGLESVTLNNKIFYTIQVVVFMFFPCLVMLVAYVVIFNIAWKQSNHIKKVLKSINRSSGSIPTRSTKEAKNTLKVFGTVVVMFVFCWCLSAFRSIVFYYDLMKLDFDVVITSRFLLVSNSAINPIIYALWKRDIKMEFRKLFRLNNRMVRPSSSTFRSSQVFGNDTSIKDIGSDDKRSRAGSTHDIALPDVNNLDKPLNNIVKEEIAENVETTEPTQVDSPPPEPLTTATLKYGIVNLVVDVDGLV